MSEMLTRPERSCELGLARHQLGKFYADPCAWCTNRGERLFGRTYCKTSGRTFPRCGNTPGTQFEPDHDKIQGIAR